MAGVTLVEPTLSFACGAAQLLSVLSVTGAESTEQAGSSEVLPPLS